LFLLIHLVSLLEQALEQALAISFQPSIREYDPGTGNNFWLQGIDYCQYCTPTLDM